MCGVCSCGSLFDVWVVIVTSVHVYFEGIDLLLLSFVARWLRSFALLSVLRSLLASLVTRRQVWPAVCALRIKGILPCILGVTQVSNKIHKN